MYSCTGDGFCAISSKSSKKALPFMEMEQEEAWGSSEGGYLGNHFQGISHPVSPWRPHPLC